MNKKQYIQWTKKVSDIPDKVSVKSEIEKYPYCMLFHLIQSMKIKTKEHISVLAVLHPCRNKLSALLSKRTEEKETIVKEVVAKFRNKEDLLDILQKRMDELNNNSDTNSKNEQIEILPEEPPPSSIFLDELIEKFNKLPPTISFDPINSDDEMDNKDFGKSSVIDQSNIISETLAELYYSQGIYDKALKIYEALMLKYPKKNDTFAKIIADIKSKNNNTN
jgi:hypothetical protein